MPLTILDLPIEILNLIIETEPGRKCRLDTCGLLRLTCKELDAKLLRYFGVNFFKRIRVPLTAHHVTDLHRLSQGPLAHFVESLMFDVDAIVSFKPEDGNSASEFLEEDAQFLINTSIGNQLAVLNEGTFALLFESCPALLGPTLSRLSSLKQVHIWKPHHYGVVTDQTREQFSGVWSMVIRNLFPVVLSQISHLEVLSADSQLPLYACASVLENMAPYWKHHEALTTLRFGLGFGSNSSTSGAVIQHAYILKKLLDTSPNLVNLDLSFDDSDMSSTFFRLLSNSTSSVHHSSYSKIQDLSLSHLKTTFSDLQNFLLSHKLTIEALKLKLINFDTRVFGFGIFFATQLPHLKEISLNALSFGRFGLSFWELHDQRPVCQELKDPISIDGEKWEYVYQDEEEPGWGLVLNQADGDDIEYWMTAVDAHDEWERKHLWWEYY